MRLPARLTCLLAAMLLLALPAVAHAHQLQVLDPGSQEIDAGQAVPARLIHATLVEAGDSLVVTITPGDVPIQARLLVPNRDPEQGYDLQAQPNVSLTWTGGGAQSAKTESGDEPETVVDEVTGIEYIDLGSLDLQASNGQAKLTIVRGAEPTRVALLVGSPDDPFAAIDADQTPRAAVETRLWAETPPPGTEAEPEAAPEPDRRYALYGAGLALLAVVVAIWWIRAGRAGSRRKGVERATLERAERAERADRES